MPDVVEIPGSDFHPRDRLRRGHRQARPLTEDERRAPLDITVALREGTVTSRAAAVARVSRWARGEGVGVVTAERGATSVTLRAPVGRFESVFGVRLERHRQSALTLARWLRERPEVRRVLHPALEDDPGHALWKRDFLGSSGLFAIELAPCTDAQPASPTAISPGDTRSGLFAVGLSTSPQ